MSTTHRERSRRHAPEPEKSRRSYDSQSRSVRSKDVRRINRTGDSRSVESSHIDVETLDDLRPESLFQRDRSGSEQSRRQGPPAIPNHSSHQRGRSLQGLGTQYVSLFGSGNIT
jgi:hypothetical protein